MNTEYKNDFPTAQAAEYGGQPRPMLSTRRYKDHYEPETEKESQLDWKTDMKFDFFVAAPLSLGFTLIASKSPVSQPVNFISLHSTMTKEPDARYLYILVFCLSRYYPA